MEIHLKIVGVLLIVLASIHLVFPRYFNWAEELKSSSLINRQMMTVHTFFIALTVLLMGLLCLTSSTEIAETDLGKKIALGLGLFWTVRLIIQFFGYSTALWKGKRFETSMHIVFSVLWTYLSVVFWITYFN
ncbi:hypothetical protein FAZ19_17230 [Sphingobacterium alkalisoli]|uniref:DUF4345 domain-containing protein n=1 Tax=Sphingobacterium alkalisoli TaxID=1874115 RepID=A0A4U0GY56_9SPHI|nr:hypothetical protein [Sphingobacterium alkalisoli]TJY63996.1 hypothetical protein FAZ19_17230 [Sphingobacterium alkalisoli]